MRQDGERKINPFTNSHKFNINHLMLLCSCKTIHPDISKFAEISVQKEREEKVKGERDRLSEKLILPQNLKCYMNFYKK